MSAAFLDVKGITKSFPGVVALRGVDFACHRGEVHGLVGENGAGKSTLVKILAGAYRADSGQVYFDGALRHFNSPRESQQAGIGVIYQEFTLLPAMSVADNIYLGREMIGRGLVNHRRMRCEAQALLDRLGCNIDARQMVGQLSVAQQQITEIAKALSLNARLIIMDEPSATLGGPELARLFEMIRSLRTDGVTLIYISHRLTEIFEICDRVTVLKDGELVDTQLAAETNQAELVRMMVGRQFADVFPPPDTSDSKPLVLRVTGLNSGNLLKDVSFDLHAGEVLGVAGLAGSGQTELVRAIFGADSDVSGTIELDGKAIRVTSPQKAIHAGVAMAPEDRKGHGLLLSLTVRENITLPILHRFRHFLAISERREAEAVHSMIESLSIKVTDSGQIVGQLSGGNQQKVVLAKCLSSAPRVLLLDEPTRGIDVGAKFEIYKLIRDMANQGTAVLFVSSELPEILGMSDRILVLSRGHLMGILDRSEATEERVMELATGVSACAPYTAPEVSGDASG